MSAFALHLATMLALTANPLGPGDHVRSLKMGEVTRSYLVHVPPKYEAKKPTPVTKKTYRPGKDGSEVVLFIIESGGHTWPGRQPPVNFLGKSTKNISANDLIWEFFEKHPMK